MQDRIALAEPDFRVTSTEGDEPSRFHVSGDPPSIEWEPPKPLPHKLLPVDPFDLFLMPEVFRLWILDIAARLQCPADFPAVAAMIVLAAIVGRKIGIRPQQRTEWLVVPNLWGAIIGRPGIMKSPALAEPHSVLRKFELAAKQKFDEAMREFATESLVTKTATEHLKAELKAAMKDERPTADIKRRLAELHAEKPIRRRYEMNDGTVEKLGAILSENPNGLLVFRDELTGFLKSLDKDGQEGARSFYLECWNGTDSFTVDRIERGTVDIPSAIVSILGGIQPGPLSDYLRKAAAGGAGDDGLLQRFQLAVWPDCLTLWENVDRAPDQRAAQRAFEAYERLDSLNPYAINAQADSSDGVPYLRFEADAQQAFDNWRETELEPRVRSGNEHPAIEGHLSKYRSLVPTLALLCHLADEPEGGPVLLQSVERAIKWARYLESHARRIYGSISCQANESAHALASKIQDGSLKDGFTLRDVYRPKWSSLASKDAASAAVDVLIDIDWIHPEQCDTGGKPKTVFRVNPGVTVG